ncbi:hypothetical protein Tco_1526911 [Tanacetum coccineum]
MHDTYHVSNLKKCLADTNLHVQLDEIKVDKTLRFVEEPVEIMDREIKKLKRKKIALVKVRWISKHGPEISSRRGYCNIFGVPNLVNLYVTTSTTKLRHNQIVRIKRLHDDLEVTAAKVKIEENILSSYYCLYKSYNCSKIKTAKRVYTVKREWIKTEERIMIDWRSRLLT